MKPAGRSRAALKPAGVLFTGLTRVPVSVDDETAVGVISQALFPCSATVQHAERSFVILADRTMPDPSGQERCTICRTYIHFVVHLRFRLAERFGNDNGVQKRISFGCRRAGACHAGSRRAGTGGPQ